MNDDSFERLLALNPAVVDSAKAVAVGAVAAMPNELQPRDEPAHVYRATGSRTDQSEQPT